MKKLVLISGFAITVCILSGCNSETKEKPVVNNESKEVTRPETNNTITKDFISDPIKDEVISAHLTSYNRNDDDSFVGEVIELNLDFENLSGEKLYVSADELSIDGEMLSSKLGINFFEEISGGKTAKMLIEIYDIEGAPLETVPEINDNVEFTLNVYNEDDSINIDYKIIGSLK